MRRGKTRTLGVWGAMTERKGPAVLIHYDELTDALYLSTIPTEKLSLLDAESFGQGIGVSTLREVDPAEAERRLGAGLLRGAT